MVWTRSTPWLVLVVTAWAGSRACVMRTDGWVPASLENRTLLAPVVVAGTVLRLRDRSPSPPAGSGEYSAEVAVREVYKGYPYLGRVPALADADADAGGGRTAYLVGGFGPRQRCLAEVEPGGEYIMFLTAVPVRGGRAEEEEEKEGAGGTARLLARYDDIFGAAVEFDAAREARVNKVVGWRVWAPWSSCTVTCGQGLQRRRRLCVQDVPDACEGAAEQSRRCNSFKCQDVKDVLQLMSLSSFPPGVRRSPRRKAYRISADAVLKLPISAVYPGGFPEEFSILLVVRTPRYFSSQRSGYLYAVLVTGSDGGVRLGVQLGTSPALVYGRPDRDSPGKVRPDAVTFGRYAVLERQWNALAFSVRRDSVTMHADCTQEFRVGLGEGEAIRIGNTSGDISIGNPKANMIDMYFEGDLEQLVLIADPDAAALQCSSPVGTFLSDQAWPSMNISDNLQGGMDSMLMVPAPGVVVKPKPDPPIPVGDSVATPTARAATAGSANRRRDNEVAAPPPEHESPGGRGATTPAPRYNENNFDFSADIFDNSLPGRDGAPSGPVGGQPPGVDAGSRSGVLRVPEADFGALPTTPIEISTAEETGGSDRKLSPESAVTEQDVPKPSAPTTVKSAEPSSYTQAPEAAASATARPAAELTAAASPALPTTVPTTEPATSRPTKAATVKLRLESAHRPDSVEVGHREPGSESGSAEVKEVLESWSTWSTCSRTCGTGTRYRFSRCRPGSRLLDCKTGRGIAAQTQTCHLKGCKVPWLKWSHWSMCSRTCGDGVEMRMAYCYDNKVPGCENGQKIVVERRRCRRRHCYDVCTPSCRNGGVCGFDRKCNCPTGYLGASCEIELCSHPCQNGGQCVAKDYCRCPTGYAPPRCSPVCNPRCRNGGTCKAPNECECPPAYTGRECERAACSRPCQNGGTCVGLNTCSCAQGYHGTNCEHASCSPACANGATCVRPGFCRCPPAYRGRTCEIAYCRVTCRNGGRCIGPDTCACAPGFRGASCHRRTSSLRHVPRENHQRPLLPSNFARTHPGMRRRRQCKIQTSLVSYQRSYVRPVAMTTKVKCGYWQPVLCTQTRMGYEAAYRTFYRVAYRRECLSDVQP